jgi:hypothetical protein
LGIRFVAVALLLVGVLPVNATLVLAALSSLVFPALACVFRLQATPPFPDEPPEARRILLRWVAVEVLYAGWLVLLAVMSVTPIPDVFDRLRSAIYHERTLIVLAVYAGVIFGGDQFVARLTAPFRKNVAGTSEPDDLQAGRYIGWAERFLVITFVAAGYSDPVGLLVAAKTAARFPEIRKDAGGHAAEYFLIGTLASVGLALCGGLTLRTTVANP